MGNQNIGCVGSHTTCITLFYSLFSVCPFLSFSALTVVTLLVLRPNFILSLSLSTLSRENSPLPQHLYFLQRTFSLSRISFTWPPLFFLVRRKFSLAIALFSFSSRKFLLATAFFLSSEKVFLSHRFFFLSPEKVSLGHRFFS